MAQQPPTTALPAELPAGLAWGRVPAVSARLARFAVRQPVAALSALIVVAMVVMAIFAPLIAPHDPLAINPRDRLLDPSGDHFFGTDSIGHDIFSQVVYGARVSLLVGLGATLAGTGIGSIIGLVTGYLGGLLDMLVQRIMDAVQAIPALVLLLLSAAILREGDFREPFAILNPVFRNDLLSVIVILSLLIAPYASRVVRGVVLSTREDQYVLAARAIGAQPARIMAFHILPNVFAPIIVICSITIGAAILVEGALSFLGQGIQPDDPTWKTSWGTMLRPANLQYMQQAPLLAVFPGAAITLAVLAFNMLGDTLRDVLDPQLRGGA